MRCTVCGGDLSATRTDLPFKVTETAIVILKCLPVLACQRCPEYLIEDDVLSQVDELLSGVRSSSELTIIRYADSRDDNPGVEAAWAVEVERRHAEIKSGASTR